MIGALNLKYQCYFPGAELDRKSQLFIKDKEVNYQPGQWTDDGDLARFLSVPRGIYGGAAASAQTSLGSCGGGARGRGLSQVPPGSWKGESSQVCAKPGSFQSCESYRPLLSFLLPRIPVSLSPRSFLLQVFLCRLLLFSLPPPSVLLHRTRRVSFIYLFFTPAINTLLGLPSFSP